MKIGGREIKGKNRVTVVFPREGGEDIAFIAEAVSDFSRINEFINMPEPPVIQKPGGVVEKNFNDSGYKAQIDSYNITRMAWIVLESLKPSKIEWDTVDMDNPSTWTNYTKDLEQAGFSDIEINLIGNAVLEANALDEEKLEAARKVFLHGQVEAEKSTSGQRTPQ